MKQIASLFAVLLSIILIPIGYASENVPMDAVTMTQPSSSSPTGSFGVVVTKDNKLITKAGPVFTEGGDYIGLKLPYLLSNPKPISYPRWAISNGWQGECSIAIVFDTVFKIQLNNFSTTPVLCNC